MACTATYSLVAKTRSGEVVAEREKTIERVFFNARDKGGEACSLAMEEAYETVTDRVLDSLEARRKR